MSRLFRSLAVAAAAATVAFAAASSPAAAAAGSSTTTDPAAAAAGWLAQQLVDGNHLVYSFDGTTFDGGGTADLIYALAAAKSGKSTIDDAISYFEQHVAEYTSLSDTSGQPGPFDGSVGKTAVAAFVAGADPTHFGGYDLLQALKDDECTAESGDPNDFTVPVCPAAGAARNIFSSISESLVVTAEARGAAIAGKYAPSQAAIDYLLSLQCTDGGFTSSTAGGNGCTSDPDATGYAAMALQAAGGHGTELGKAADWLESVRNANGSWSSQGGQNVDSTGLAAAGLGAAERSTASSRDWLVSQQVTDGPTVGKDASRGALKYQGKFDPSASVKGTSDGVLGMVADASLATLDDTGAAAGTPVLALDDPTLAHASVRSGGTQTVTGTGFSAGEKVRVVLHSTPIVVGTVTANSAGTASLSFIVPKSLSAGAHTVVLTGQSSGLETEIPFTIVKTAVVPNEPITPSPTATTPATPVLANTGQDGRQTREELIVGLGCVALGGAALLLGRRGKRAR